MKLQSNDLLHCHITRKKVSIRILSIRNDGGWGGHRGFIQNVLAVNVSFLRLVKNKRCYSCIAGWFWMFNDRTRNKIKLNVNVIKKPNKLQRC